MSGVCLDNDVSLSMQPELAAKRHDVEHTRDLPRMRKALDGHQLLHAAQRGATFVTHNRNDFRHVHDAWRHWPAAWGCRMEHAGILIVPQGIQPAQVAQAIHERLTSGPPLANELYEWTPQKGWQHQPFRP